MAKRLAPFDVVVIMRERTPISAALLQRLPQLKLLITSGMRNAAIDLPAAREQGITVCGTASNSQPPAELTSGADPGPGPSHTSRSRCLAGRGPWQHTVGGDLHGSTLGLIGLGKIGTQVARIGVAFGMDVVAWSGTSPPSGPTPRVSAWHRRSPRYSPRLTSSPSTSCWAHGAAV